MAATVKRLACLSVVIFLFSVAKSSSVPVLIWSNQSLPSLGSPSLAGHSLPFTEFKSQVVDRLLSTNPQTLVLFVYDKLSVDDFTVFGGSSDESSFSHLQNDLDSSTSSFIFPSVNMAYNSMINEIKKKIKGNVIEIQSKDVASLSLDKDKLKSGEMNVLICHMDPVSNARKDVLKGIFTRNDQLISDLSEKISKVTPDFTMLVTAQEPSEIVNEKQGEAMMEDHLIRTGRHLLQVDADDNVTADGTLFNGNCSFIYTKGITINMKSKNKTYDLMGSQFKFTSTTEASCSSKSTRMTVKMTSTNSTVVKTVDLTFNFNQTSNYWYCLNIEMKMTGDTPLEQVYDCRSFAAAANFSYHCSLPVVMRGLNSTLILTETQVQAFDLKKGKFSAAQDCVGFFTIPIWMGLFSVAILVTILLGGIGAMMSIQTMDRFDDPKGPCISLTNEN